MSSETATGLSKSAWLSLGIFGVLFALVLGTREERIEAGIRRLDLVSIEANEVQRVVVQGKDLRAALTRKGAGWQVSSGEEGAPSFAADSALVKSALDALASLSADTFVTGRAAKHADLEIDDEKGLRVQVEAGAKSLDLVFGRAGKGGGNYLRPAGSDEVFAGKGSFAALVKKDVKGWRKRKLLDAEADELSQIEIEKPGSERLVLVGTRAEGQMSRSWALSPGTSLPEGFRLDESAAGRIATSVAGLRAADFADEAKAEDVGLNEAQNEGGRLTITLAEGKKIALRFGKEDDKKRVYAQIEGDPQLYLLASYSVTSSLKTLQDLRDLSILPFDAAQVERFVVQKGNDRVEVQKQEGTYALVSPNPAPAGFEFDAAGVEGKLAGITRIKASAWEASPAQTGLERPDITVEVSLVGGETRRLLIGREAKKGEGGAQEFYVQGSDGLVYRLPSYQKGRFDNALDLFKKVAPPPMPAGGGGSGLDSLPPELRKQLEAAMRNQGM